MKKTLLKKKVALLQDFSQRKKKDKFDFVKSCSEDYIHTVCEGCYNVLHAKDKISRSRKYYL